MGIVIAREPSRAVKTTCPVYVPMARVGPATTLTLKFSGVLHSVQPLKLALSTVNQGPPVDVEELTLIWKLVPVLAAVRICGNGFAPFGEVVEGMDSV